MAKALKISIYTGGAIVACLYALCFSTNGYGAKVEIGSSTSGPAEVYAASCARCHGADGRARTAKGKRVGATDFTARDWNTDEGRGIRIITNGKGEMPSFKNKLSAKEIRSVFGYVVGLRR